MLQIRLHGNLVAQLKGVPLIDFTPNQPNI